MAGHDEKRRLIFNRLQNGLENIDRILSPTLPSAERLRGGQAAEPAGDDSGWSGMVRVTLR